VTIRDALNAGGEQLRAAGCPTPHVDAELLLGHALSVSRTALFAEPERALTGEEEARYRSFLGRRAAREPAAYILGEWGFRRLTLAVDSRVLVPRPETEAVVERCLELLDGIDAPLVLDVGTGAGTIALALADEHPGARIVATDISVDALALANENRSRTGAEDRVELVLGHLVAGVRGPFDLLVSNPPYVRHEELASLEPEIRLYEPYEAVVEAGHTDAIVRRALDVVRPGGWLVLETSELRGADVAAELRALGYEEVAVRKDLTGRDRVVEGRVGGTSSVGG
jgi:release factor glutamine methyltransferase